MTQETKACTYLSAKVTAALFPLVNSFLAEKNHRSFLLLQLLNKNTKDYVKDKIIPHMVPGDDIPAMPDVDPKYKTKVLAIYREFQELIINAPEFYEEMQASIGDEKKISKSSYEAIHISFEGKFFKEELVALCRRYPYYARLVMEVPFLKEKLPKREREFVRFPNMASQIFGAITAAVLSLVITALIRIVLLLAYCLTSVGVAVYVGLTSPYYLLYKWPYKMCTDPNFFQDAREFMLRSFAWIFFPIYCLLYPLYSFFMGGYLGKKYGITECLNIPDVFQYQQQQTAEQNECVECSDEDDEDDYISLRFLYLWPTQYFLAAILNSFHSQKIYLQKFPLTIAEIAINPAPGALSPFGCPPILFYTPPLGPIALPAARLDRKGAPEPMRALPADIKRTHVNEYKENKYDVDEREERLDEKRTDGRKFKNNRGNGEEKLRDSYAVDSSSEIELADLQPVYTWGDTVAAASRSPLS
jgi:hypothetical protein